jgi:ribose transport system permease protein
VPFASIAGTLSFPFLSRWSSTVRASSMPRLGRSGALRFAAPDRTIVSTGCQAAISRKSSSPLPGSCAAMPGITLMIEQTACLQRFAPISALIAVIAFFALFAPGFAQVDNLVDVLLNNFALLATASLGMKLALSLGTSIDVASLAFVLLSAHHVGVVPAAFGGRAAALLVGAFNGVLTGWLGIAPFLATLGTLFIGQTVQQLATDDGQPVYLLDTALPPLFSELAHGALAGLPVLLWIVAVLALVVHVTLAHSTRG